MEPTITLADALAWSDAELYGALGRLVAPAQAASTPGKDADRGIAWINRNWQALRRQICQDQRIVSLRSLLERDVAMEAATLSDVLLASLGKPAAFVVATIIARQGLATLCREDL